MATHILPITVAWLLRVILSNPRNKSWLKQTKKKCGHTLSSGHCHGDVDSLDANHHFQIWACLTLHWNVLLNGPIAVVLWFQPRSFGFKGMGDLWSLLRCEVLWKELKFHDSEYVILLARQKKWDSPFFHCCFPQEDTMSLQEFQEWINVLSTHSSWKLS